MKTCDLNVAQNASEIDRPPYGRRYYVNTSLQYMYINDLRDIRNTATINEILDGILCFYFIVSTVKAADTLPYRHLLTYTQLTNYETLM
ncbi:hypothetical protein PsorP6_001102 [Peronosclerospora sorghi]|uniref:Uncharacterized protein n=1 Tax=Peronosclerospora sorghi TaxID=230839 RepID=A0ACC0WRH6_9STRA|nr:hypothetical protein PsorP6_001102 [Peronosclerospora sorghi]